MKASDYGGETANQVGEWAYSDSEDGNGDGLWTDCASSRESAIEEAKAYAIDQHGDDCCCCYVAECKEYEPKINVYSILETLTDNAYDECGEASEFWLGNLPVAEVRSLQKALDDAFGKWLTDTKNWPRFSRIGKVERIEIEPKETT